MTNNNPTHPTILYNMTKKSLKIPKWSSGSGRRTDNTISKTLHIKQLQIE